MRIKQQIRYLKRDKLFSIVNILGLSISFSLIFLLLIFIRTENNVDDFHEKNIYRLVRANECAFSPPFGQYIVDNIEGVESFCRVFVLDATLKSDENLLRTPNCYYTDTNFLDMFSVQIMNGDSKEILNTKNSVIISESFAKKLLFLKTLDKIHISPRLMLSSRLMQWAIILIAITLRNMIGVSFYQHYM
jgi:putative ABC transport system permease protein